MVDTGPATSIETVLRGIHHIGFKPQDLDLIILTHIHLDHAGGVGVLMKPTRARVLVHQLKVNLRPVIEYWSASDIPMSAIEHVRYYRKKHGV